MSKLEGARRIAHYELQAELGRGATGIVYATRDLRQERSVAIKLLEPKDSAERPLRETRAAALLDHPNIVRVYEIAEEDGRRFIAMELVPGSTLEEVLRVTRAS